MIRLGNVAKQRAAKIGLPKSLHIFNMDVKKDVPYVKLTPAERKKVENMRKIRGNMIILKLPKIKQRRKPNTDKIIE